MRVILIIIFNFTHGLNFREYYKTIFDKNVFLYRRMNKIKFTVTVALLMAIILVIGEYNASIYGNALYVGYKDVMFGTKIGRLVGVGLADKENSFFVTQDVDFKTKEGSSLLVNKFCHTYNTYNLFLFSC